MTVERVKYKKFNDDKKYTAYISWVDGARGDAALKSLMKEKIPDFYLLTTRTLIEANIVMECPF